MRTDEELKELIELTYKISRGKACSSEFPELNKDDYERFQILSSIDVFEKEIDKFQKTNDLDRWDVVVRGLNDHHLTKSKNINEECFNYFTARLSELNLQLRLPLEHYQEFPSYPYYN